MAKMQQAGFLEKHVEKLVLGLAAVLLLVVLFTWVFRSPHRFTSSSGAAIAPEQIPADIKTLAERAQRAIENRTWPKPNIPRYRDQVTQTFEQPVRGKLEPLEGLTPGMAELELDPRVKIRGEKIPRMEPLPALREIRVAAHQETVVLPVDPSMAMNVMTAAEAVDIYAAHVTAVLDYARMIEPWKPLQRDRGFPVTVLFLEVLAERQERLPDGSWGPTVDIQSYRDTGATVGRMTSSFLPPLEDPRNLTDPTTRTMYVEQLKTAYGAQDMQYWIIQPPYPQVFWPDVLNWGTWKHHLPRTSVSALELIGPLLQTDQPPQPSPLLMAILSARTTPGTRGTGPAREFGEPGGPARTFPGGPRGAMGGDFGDGGGMFRGSMGAVPGAGAPVDVSQERAMRRLTDIQKLIEAGNYDKAIRDLENLIRQYPNVATEANYLLDQARELKRQGTLPPVTPTPPLAQQCQSGIVQLWLHDTTCQAGKTYRYRLTLKLFNPLFGQADSLPLTNRADAEPLTLSTSSDWSEPVTVLPEIEFFVLSGSRENQDVRFEIFRQQLGLWQVQQFPIKAGELLGGSKTLKLLDQVQQSRVLEQTVDFQTAHILVDCDYDRAGLGTSASATIGITETLTATLLSPEGSLVVRDLAVDKKSTLRAGLAEKAKLAAEAIKYVNSQAGLGALGAPSFQMPGVPSMPRYPSGPRGPGSFGPGDEDFGR